MNNPTPSADTSDRGAIALFCDDIRQESNGKLILIGLYSDVMVLPSIPALVKGLVIRVTAYTPIDRPFSKFHMTLLQDDKTVYFESHDTSGWLESIRKGMAELPADFHSKIEGVQRFTMHSLLIVPPFTVESECVFRIRIDTESGQIRAGGLSIKLRPTDG